MCCVHGQSYRIANRNGSLCVAQPTVQRDAVYAKLTPRDQLVSKSLADGLRGASQSASRVQADSCCFAWAQAVASHAGRTGPAYLGSADHGVIPPDLVSDVGIGVIARVV